MKNVTLLVLAFGLFAFNVSATNLNPIKPTDDLRIQMVDLIGSNYVDDMNENEYFAEVLFTVNSNKKLIILSVESENTELESILKRRLNYKKVNHQPTKPGEIYLLPVKIIKEI